MIIQHFLKWKDSADVGKRTAAASALARAYLASDLDLDDRVAADAAMTMLLEDPSPKVRLALAEALSTSINAPRQIVTALIHDQIEIASIVIARSPLVADADLIIRARTSSGRLQCVMANRPEVSQRLALTLAQHGGPDCALALLTNPNARLCADAFFVLTDRFGDQPSLRGALLERGDLEPSLRYRLMKLAADALGGSPLIGSVLGRDTARHMVYDAGQRGICALLETVDGTETSAPLVDMVRDAGDLTTIVMIRALCRGQIDFLAAALSSLTDISPQKVTAILVNERTNQLRALIANAGFANSVQPVFITAVRMWRDVAVGRLSASAQEVTRRLLDQVEDAAAQTLSAANDDLAGLLRTIHLELVRENAKAHARDLAAA